MIVGRDGCIRMMVEVKSATDQIRPEQRPMHALLRRVGFDVRAVREDDIPALLAGLGQEDRSVRVLPELAPRRRPQNALDPADELAKAITAPWPDAGLGGAKAAQ